MALKSGFFDSLNGDRKYNSVQMSQIFDGIINDGVFQNIGGAFFVNANEGMNVNVSVGRAWFNSTWTYNDSEYGINIDESNIVYPRIDTICLKIDSTLAVRGNSIVVLKGTPSSTPVAPVYVDTDEIHYHPLADIYVGAGVTEIVQANITNRVGTSTTPFVTGILETIDTDELLVQWEAQFSVWFEHIRGQLDEDAAGHLQNEIDELNADKADKDLSNVIGALPVTNGGTGAVTAANARTNLGLGNAATQAVANNLTTTTSGSVLDARQGKALNDKITADWINKGRAYVGSNNIQLDTSKKTTMFVYSVSGSNYYIDANIFPTSYITSNFRNQNEGNSHFWMCGDINGWARINFTCSATGVLAVYGSSSSAPTAWQPSITVYQK